MYMPILNFTYPLRCLRVPPGVRVPPLEYHWFRTWIGMGELIYAYKMLAGKPEELWPLRRPRHRCVDDIKMDHKGRGVRVWAEFRWLKIRSCVGILWTWRWTSEFLKGGEYLDKLSDYQFLKDSTPWSFQPLHVGVGLRMLHRSGFKTQSCWVKSAESLAWVLIFCEFFCLFSSLLVSYLTAAVMRSLHKVREMNA
jgi:hypothetical protein